MTQVAPDPPDLTTHRTPDAVIRRFHSPQGARLPGWEEINCERLAEKAGITAKHLRGVLAGRFGTTLRYIERIAEALEMTPGEVVERITKARAIDDQRYEEARQRWLERQAKRQQRKTK